MDSTVEYAAISFAGCFSDSCMLLQNNDAQWFAPTLAGQFSSAGASDYAAANYADIIRLHSVEPSPCDHGRIGQGAAGDAQRGAACPILWRINTGISSLCFAAEAAKHSFRPLLPRNWFGQV